MIDNKKAPVALTTEALVKAFLYYGLEHVFQTNATSSIVFVTIATKFHVR
ncbi:MAG: hypothetical protein ACJAS1_004998, partial [Oleiphilaceae bacterium]